jgi:hypothetical protein
MSGAGMMAENGCLRQAPRRVIWFLCIHDRHRVDLDCGSRHPSLCSTSRGVSEARGLLFPLGRIPWLFRLSHIAYTSGGGS